jgi:hypothetical protein
MSAVALGGLVPAYVACSSSTNSSSSSTNAGGTNSSVTSSSTSSAAPSGGDGGTTSGSCGSVTVTPASPAPTSGGIIDDMSSAAPATGGYWYTYSNRSVPNSEPPIFTTDAGTVMPLEGDPFPPDMGPTSCVPSFTTSTFTDFHYREFLINAVPAWGGGFGMDLTDFMPDGGPVPFNSCDAGTIFDVHDLNGNTGIPQPYNASQYSGISFWGISLGAGSVSVEVHMDDQQTDPWGGVCNPCAGGSAKCSDSGANTCPCSDNFIKTVKFLPATWKQYTVSFTDMTGFKTQNWSGQGLKTFDPTTLYNIHFQITAGSGKTGDVDIAVADLEWTK